MAGWPIRGAGSQLAVRGGVDGGRAATFAILMPSSAWAQTAGPSLATKLPTTTAPVQSTAESLAATDADDQLDEAEEDFADLALEELMQIQVTSVAGRAQPLLDMPAAIYVVTAEDIRRSGHRSIAEALRMVPGLTVGQISPSAWAISSRGFVDRFANNLLVLIDGRTVYDPLFSGVFWHVQDMMFEDLDRIEVVRGPGATLWGANAVNGVINITTKSAKETQGLYIVGGGGTEEQGFGALRYGGQLNQNTYFRVWTKYDNHDNFDNITGASEPNDWDMYRGGFRLDMEGDDDLQMTVQGDIYATGRINERVRVPVPGADLTFTTADLNQQGYRVRATDSLTFDVATFYNVYDDLITFPVKPEAPHLAILDWMMLDLDGLELCRKIRQHAEGGRSYILLLTAKMQKEDIVVGLQSGADDYIIKPFHLDELQARVAVGKRIVELQERLADRVQELERALSEVKRLRGLLPICSYCKRIREGDEYTKSVEAYLAQHSDAKFSHGVCRDCYERFVKPQLEML